MPRLCFIFLFLVSVNTYGQFRDLGDVIDYVKAPKKTLTDSLKNWGYKPFFNNVNYTEYHYKSFGVPLFIRTLNVAGNTGILKGVEWNGLAGESLRYVRDLQYYGFTAKQKFDEYTFLYESQDFKFLVLFIPEKEEAQFTLKWKKYK